MNRRMLAVVYLICSLVFLRIAGLHVHLPDHADAHDHAGADAVHVANVVQHGAPHSGDIDVGNLDASLVKNPVPGLDQPVVSAAAPRINWKPATFLYYSSPDRDTSSWSKFRYHQPPSHAPPV